MIKVGLHLTTDGLTAINMRHFPVSDPFIIILEWNIYLCLKPLQYNHSFGLTLIHKKLRFFNIVIKTSANKQFV